MEKATFFIRFAAWMIDFLAMFFIAVVVAIVLGTLSGITSGTDSTLLSIISGGIAFLLIVILFLLQFVYFGYFWGKDGKSLGMNLFSIKVVRRTPGEDISFLRGAFRGTLGYWVSGVFFSLGYIWAAIDADKEAWHDKIFDTWVVRENFQ